MMAVRVVMFCVAMALLTAAACTAHLDYMILHRALKQITRMGQVQLSLWLIIKLGPPIVHVCLIEDGVN